jgi:hypothetical protein
VVTQETRAKIGAAISKGHATVGSSVQVQWEEEFKAFVAHEGMPSTDRPAGVGLWLKNQRARLKGYAKNDNVWQPILQD